MRAINTGWLLLLLLQAPQALAGSIAAELDHNEGAPGEAFVLTLTLEGSRNGDPQIPTVDGLQIRQQGMSQSMIYNNGQSSTQLRLTLVVEPERPGDFTIPSITAELDGQKVATVPLTLKIKGAGAQANTQTNPAANGQQQAAGAAKNGKANPKAANADTGGVFIERECDNTSPYIGEQVVCVVRLYHRGNLNGGQRVSQSSPDFRRFNVDGEKRYQKIVRGQHYGVIELKEIVIATKAGTLQLPPYTIDARILVWNKRNNPLDKFFDNFGGGVFNFDLNYTEERAVTVASEADTFTVKPLPAAGKPHDFSGLVGTYQLDTNLSKNHITAGDTVTITISLTGNGVSDTLADIAPPLANIGKVYPDKPEYSEQITPEHGINSKRVYKYALVPTKNGDYDLGSVEVPVFNPKLNTYVTLKSDIGRLIVDPGQAEQHPALIGTAPAAAVSKEEVKVLGSDLIGLHHDADVSSQQTITSSDKVVMAATAALPLSSAFLAFCFVSFRSRNNEDTAERRRSRAYRTFKEGMGRAQVALAAGRVEAALNEGHAQLRLYLGDKLGVQGSALAAREIDTLLITLGAGPEARKQLGDVVGALERLEFGGQIPSLAQSAELLAALDAVAYGLEKV